MTSGSKNKYSFLFTYETSISVGLFSGSEQGPDDLELACSCTGLVSRAQEPSVLRSPFGLSVCLWADVPEQSCHFNHLQTHPGLFTCSHCGCRVQRMGSVMIGGEMLSSFSGVEALERLFTALKTRNMPKLFEGM